MTGIAVPDHPGGSDQESRTGPVDRVAGPGQEPATQRTMAVLPLLDWSLPLSSVPPCATTRAIVTEQPYSYKLWGAETRIRAVSRHSMPSVDALPAFG